jgi:ribosome maturation factor RimP
MIDKSIIIKLLEQKLEGTDVFPVEVLVKPNNIIRVFLDSDSAVTLKHCAEINKFIEANLDREKEDFELEVSSAGLDQPLRMIRQYKNNIGKQIKIITNDGRLLTGELHAVNSETIDLAVVDEDEKTKNKLKKEISIIQILFSDIKKAKRIVSF